MTLDGRTLLVAIDQIPAPGCAKMIQGEGMLTVDEDIIGQENERRGDLYILFDIEFPKRLAQPTRKEELAEALAAN